MSAEVERYLKLKDEIIELDKKAAGYEADLKTVTEQRDAILRKYNVADVLLLKKVSDELGAAIKAALDHWEGMISSVKTTLSSKQS